MFRVALITDKGEVLGKNFETKSEIDDYLLSIMETKGVKRYRIKDKTTNEIIETEQGKRKGVENGKR